MILHHPDAHRPTSEWAESRALHVAAAYSNPFRWRTRRELANDFRRHMAHSANVVLHFAELAYGDRPFEVTDRACENDVQLRTAHELFHKENLLNAAIRSFPADWQYGAVIDADFHFTRHDWALEAVHQLQHYDFVQLFSSYSDLSGETLGTGHRVIGSNGGFVSNYVANGYQLPHGYSPGGWSAPGCGGGGTYAPGQRPIKRAPGATGGAWAFRRSAFDTVGGLLDRCILGSGDWFMAFGLVGEDLEDDKRIDAYPTDYRRYIRSWQRRAARLKRNVGYVDGHAVHHFHGPKTRRGYGTRDQILISNEYNPGDDVFPDWQGILQLTPHKPALRDAIRAYFLSRSEDIPHMEAGR